jgi:Omp85 superfamily domain
MDRPLVAPRHHLAWCLAHALTLIVLIAPSAWAQTSRREALEAQRAEKAKSLAPYKPGRLESGLWMEDSQFTTRLFRPYEGWYVHFGGLVKGAGLGFGPGYKNWLFSEQALFHTYVVGSFRNYWGATTELTFPKLAGGKLELGGHGYARYWPGERYFGLGPDTLKADASTYLREGLEVKGDAIFKPTRWFKAGAQTSFRTERIDEDGSYPNYAPLGERFTEATAPGLARQPDYWVSGAFVDIDYRDYPGNTRSGGHFRVSYDTWRDRQDYGYSFRDLRVEALHAFPIFDKKRVFIARMIAQSLDSPSGNTVPFYAMPTVGGSTTLRGFREFRFRDRNAFLLNGEYRWEAFSGLDMALFADWGQVGPTWDAIDFKELESDFGLGFRFNTFKSVFLRFDIARGSEGVRFNTAFTGAF